MQAKRLAGLVATLVAASGAAQAQPFFDDFNSPTLDPAWSVYEYAGPRTSPGSPANHYSLTANPGSLRYFLDPATGGSFYNRAAYAKEGMYDPGLEIYRPIRGDQWTLETKIDFYMPHVNGRSFQQTIWFGGPGPGAMGTTFYYWRDSGYNANRLYFCADGVNCQTLDMGVAGPSNTQLWLRMERNGGLIDMEYSLDGLSWTLGDQQDWGGALDGLDQRLTLSGAAWWVTAGSYADWDYVRLTARDAPIPEPATLLLSVLGLAGLGVARWRCRQ